jgi:ribonuclease HI
LEAEDVRHLLFKCPASIQIWEALELHNVIQDAMSVDRDGSAILEHLMCRTENEFEGFTEIQLKEVVATTCWYLWWLRRRRTHDEPTPPPNRCKFSILSIVTNSGNVYGKKKLTNVKWVRPEVRHVKLNVDASFHEDAKAGSMGAVLRDYRGECIAAPSSYIENVNSATMAEAYAMKEGLDLACRMGCNNIIAESDSLEVIAAMNDSETWWCEAAAVFAECVDKVTTIGAVSFMHIGREANQVAHELARDSYSSKLSCTWVDEPPRFILEKLLNDVIM